MPKILAIDDKKDNLTTISALLNVLIPDCDVITAQSGPDGLRKAETELPDTILLDIRMPGMDGYEVCNRLKDNEQTKNIPVIMISAIHTESEDLVRGLDSGADAYLAKPIDEYVLVAQIRTALRVKKAEDHLRNQKNHLEHVVRERTKELRCLYNISKLIENHDLSLEEMLQKIVSFIPPAMLHPEYRCARIRLNGQEFRTSGFAETISKQVVDIIVNGKQTGALEIFSSEEKSESSENPFLTEELDFVSSIAERLGRIIERKEAEKEKRKLEVQLRQSQKMESLGLLAGGIAHDFNNVLFSIMGYSELVSEELPEGSLTKNNLNEVLTAANRAKEMVQQILAFSRQSETEKKPVRVQSIVREAIKLLKSVIPATIVIRQNIDPDAGHVLADPTQIHQIIMNLATNAYHAMEKSGGTLELTLRQEETDDDDLNISSDIRSGTYIRLTMSDSGHGMSKAVMEKIFDPYFTTKEIGKGSGMGLAVVHGIVKNHGGAITVDSQPGKGSVFTIRLPAITEKPASKIRTRTELLFGNETILLVDDDEAIVNMMGQMLERLGYQVKISFSPLEAFEMFQSKPDQFDLVITDMTMPQMTGDRFSEKLREVRSDIPVIICTGHSSLIDKEKAGIMGMFYVMKPIAMSGIAKMIRKVLDNTVS